MNEDKRKTGRPSIYTEELANKICERMARGEPIVQICKDEDMPNNDTIYSWVLENKGADKDGKNGFSDKYRLGREAQAEFLFEELLTISDRSDEIVEGADRMIAGALAANQKLKVETRKWVISKILPKKYGDKLDLTSGNEAIKPTPIINVFRNNSDKEGSESKQAD